VQRANPKRKQTHLLHERIGLANATIHQRLIVIRLFYDYLIEEGIREQNPVRKGVHSIQRGLGAARIKALLPHYYKFP